jgi:hypothetical protein
MKYKLLSILLIVGFFGSAQSDELFFIKGKIVAEIKELRDVNVLNVRSESLITTDEKGDFSLFVKINDTLKFYGLQVATKNIIITKNEVLKTLVTVHLQPKVFELKEVKVNEFKGINAVSLGILQKPAKKYTPAERRLVAAEVFKWYSPLLIPIGGMSIDGLINSLSGRTAMLKKELEIEKKERLIKRIEDHFGDEFFINTLKIPEDYVNGFLYYAVEDDKLVQAAVENNKSRLQFQLGEIAVNYLVLISKKQ